MPKIRNIIIFVAIATILVLVYFFVVKQPKEQDSLVTSPITTTLPNTSTPIATSTGNVEATSQVAQDFLSLLLSVKSIKLNDAIFSDPAFNRLHDSTIVLVPDAVVGRPNPFAQFGNDVTAPNPTTIDTTVPVTTTQQPKP